MYRNRFVPAVLRLKSGRAIAQHNRRLNFSWNGTLCNQFCGGLDPLFGLGCSPEEAGADPGLSGAGGGAGAGILKTESSTGTFNSTFLIMIFCPGPWPPVECCSMEKGKRTPSTSL